METHFLPTFLSVIRADQFMILWLFMNKRDGTYWMAKVDWFRIHLFYGGKKERKSLWEANSNCGIAWVLQSRRERQHEMQASLAE